MILEGHLHRHFYSDRTAVGIEDGVQSRGQYAEEKLGQFDGGAMRKPSEHDVTHPTELQLGCGIEPWVIVAMDGSPPRAHAIDKFAPVFQIDAHALGAADGVNG